MRTSHKLANVSPATLCMFAAITLVLATIIFHVVAPKYVHAAENDTVAAKTTRKNPPDPTTTKKQKTDKTTVITMVLLHVGAEPGQTIPTTKNDVDLATKREGGLVEAHVVPKYRVVSGETVDESNQRLAIAEND